ncbi:Carboxylesterase A [Plantibacter sp. RU18]
MDSYYSQELAWGACDDFAVTEFQAGVLAEAPVECAWLDVPLDYADPQGEKASVAVSRVAARGESIGPLVFNPGGPGSTGVVGAIALGIGFADSRIGESFDLIGFDPRGVGATTPAVDCYSASGTTRGDELFPLVAMRPALTEEDTRALVERCADGSGGMGSLAHIGTRTTAKDMDVLRAALGEKKLSFLGQSYGTRLGAVYAEEFPQHVRAMVLDGAFDPKLATVDRFATSFAGFQTAFESIAASCAVDQECPLGTDPADWTARFQSIVQPLVDNPVPAGTSELDFDKAISGVVAGFYDPALWPDVIAGIAEVQHGRGDILFDLAGGEPVDEEAEADPNFLEALFAINCMDEERLDADEIVELRVRTAEVAPFMDPGAGITEGARDACADWPAKPTLGFPYAQDIEGLPATLVVSITGDAATPHVNAISLAETLGSSLLTVEGDGHTVVSAGAANPCVDDIAAAYLIDLELPDVMPTCTATTAVEPEPTAAAQG